MGKQEQENVSVFALQCEGKASNSIPPLRDRPTSISLTIIKKGDEVIREVGCTYLDSGRCRVSNNAPCIQLFPESSARKTSVYKWKLSSPADARIMVDGERIHDIRVEKHITQAELAKAALSNPSLIGKLEHGTGKISTDPERVKLIAEKLEVDPEILIWHPSKAS